MVERDSKPSQLINWSHIYIYIHSIYIYMRESKLPLPYSINQGYWDPSLLLSGRDWFPADRKLAHPFSCCNIGRTCVNRRQTPGTCLLVQSCLWGDISRLIDNCLWGEFIHKHEKIKYPEVSSNMAGRWKIRPRDRNWWTLGYGNKSLSPGPITALPTNTTQLHPGTKLLLYKTYMNYSCHYDPTIVSKAIVNFTINGVYSHQNVGGLLLLY
jgi:hypothetical protein